MTIEFKIMKATVDDAANISALIIPLVKKFISHEYSPEGETTMLNSMSEQVIRKNIEGDFQYYLAYQQHDKGQKKTLVGLIAIKGENHLFHLFVADAFHRQGIGKKLWQFAIKQNEQRSYTVNSSFYAINFYQKLGFVAQAEAIEKSGVICYPMVCALDT